MTRGLLVLLMLTIALSLSEAQVGRCGVNQKMAQVPAYSSQVAKDQSRSIATRSVTTDSVVIPLHIIIVHPPGEAIGQGANLAMDRILSQIEATNQDFRRQNSNRDETPPDFPVGDSRISFQLASIDPSGQPTDGVTRYATNQDFDVHELDIKSATRWPRDTYLNVWVAPTLDDLGFAYIPSSLTLPSENLDGCAVISAAFGGPGFATFIPYNLGRTLTHEIGHYLGLRHVWDRDGCGSDDGIADTPRQDTSHFGCPQHPSPSCGNQGDMFMNYMDYTDDACMSAFTIGQIDYMWSVLNGSRRSLLDAGERAFEEVEPLVVAIIDHRDPSCSDSFDGQIEVAAQGGAGNYRYRLNDGVLQGNPIFRFLQAGTYWVEAVDNDGLTQRGDTLTLTAPDPILVEEVKVQAPRCHGEASGQIALTVSGAQGQASLASVSHGRINGLVVDSLPAGVVMVQVLDTAGCSVDTSIILDQPDPIVSQVEGDDITCFGAADGAVRLAAQGGSPPYEFSLTGSFFSSIDYYIGYQPGTYEAFIRDSNGCIVVDSFVVQEPDSLTLQIVVGTNTVTCQPNGGVPPYRYQLNDGPIGPDSVFSNLMVDTYTLTAYDANDCTVSQNVLITSQIELHQEEEVLFWPQPTTDLLYLADQVVALDIYSPSGQHMSSISEVDSPLPMEALPNGVYWVVVQLTSGSYRTERLVVLR